LEVLPVTSSDTVLLGRLKKGDREAFTQLMTRHGKAVFRYAWALADDVDQVDDLVQDTFLLLWQRRRSIDLVGGSLLPWLLTSCRYTAFNANRRRRSRRTSDLEDLANLPAEPVADPPSLVWLREEVRLLSDVDQQLVALCLIEGVSYDVAAGTLGITPSAARKRIQRTRARLRIARLKENQL
jgi:RNA polymerase sigma factor (sigma-70 family)